MIIVKSRLEKSFKCPFCGSDNQWIRRDFIKNQVFGLSMWNALDVKPEVDMKH